MGYWKKIPNRRIPVVVHLRIFCCRFATGGSGVLRQAVVVAARRPYAST
jgi:hypothetical protein